MIWKSWREARQAMCQASEIWEQEDTWEGIIRYKIMLGEYKSVAQFQSASPNIIVALHTFAKPSEVRESSTLLSMSAMEIRNFETSCGESSTPHVGNLEKHDVHYRGLRSTFRAAAD
jgi:hypothetical protein